MPGEATGFKHLGINADEYVKTRKGENIIQGSLSLDDGDEDGCTILVKKFHLVIHLWWERVIARGKAKSGNTTNASDSYTEEDRRTLRDWSPRHAREGQFASPSPKSCMVKPRWLRNDNGRCLCGITASARTMRCWIWRRLRLGQILVRCHQGFVAPYKSTSGEGFRYGRPSFTFPGATRLGPPAT
jgi:hypothetical protein